MHYLSYKLWGWLTHNNSIVYLKNWELSRNSWDYEKSRWKQKQNPYKDGVSFNFVHYVANLLG